MKTVLGHLEKIIALAFCVFLVAGLTYFLLGRNLVLTLCLAALIGVLAWFEIRKSKPGHITAEFSIYVVFELIFRGFFALIFLAISAISS